MDKLDQDLYNLKKHTPPPFLQERLRKQFSQRHQRKKRQLFIIAQIFNFMGIILLLPILQKIIIFMQTAQYKQSSITLLFQFLFNFKTQTQFFLRFGQSHDLISSTITITTIIGLVILAAGSSINLANWLPNQLRDV